jgi:hypothetical protein
MTIVSMILDALTDLLLSAVLVAVAARLIRMDTRSAGQELPKETGRKRIISPYRDKKDGDSR